MKKLFYIASFLSLSNLLIAQIYDFSDFPTDEESFTAADFKLYIPEDIDKYMRYNYKEAIEEAAKYGLEYLILRPSNIYGPGQKDFWLIPQIIQKFKSKKIVINNINVKRDLIYIDDFVQAIIKSIPLKKDFQIFNVGSGKSNSINEIVKILKSFFGDN